MDTQPVKHRAFTSVPKSTPLGEMIVTMRYDDSCNNGHNTFSITADMWSADTKGQRRKGDVIMAGCLHDEIREYFPEFARLIPWHLCSDDGPLHYIANTRYWAGFNNLEYARATAIAPDATIDQLTCEQWLHSRLPSLLVDFWAVMATIEWSE